MNPRDITLSLQTRTLKLDYPWTIPESGISDPGSSPSQSDYMEGTSVKAIPSQSLLEILHKVLQV